MNEVLALANSLGLKYVPLSNNAVVLGRSDPFNNMPLSPHIVFTENHTTAINPNTPYAVFSVDTQSTLTTENLQAVLGYIRMIYPKND